MLTVSKSRPHLILKHNPTVTLWVTLFFALLTVGYIVFYELGPYGALELQVDELYFYTCAARQAVDGVIFNPGCHDNKPPLIYLIHHLVQPHPYLYNAFAGKVAAFSVMLMVVGLAAGLATRLAGKAAGVCSAAFLISALATKSQFWALKTESVSFLLILSAFSLMTAPRLVSRASWFVAGLLLGLAFLVKQTNLIYLAIVCLWILFCGWRDWRATLRQLLYVAAGAVLPLLIFYAGVLWEGRAESFFASLFLYPSVYADGSPQGLYAYLTRSMDVLESVALGSEPLFWFFVLGLLQALYQFFFKAEKGEGHKNRWLVLWASLGAFAVAMVSPTFFEYHPIPIWIGTSIVAGAAFGDLWNALMLSGRAQAAILGTSLSACALVGFMKTVYHNAGHGSLLAGSFGRPTLEGAKGQYGYVLGIPWPSFYTDNGLIPASDLLFPWALPGMPKSGLYTPPPSGSDKGQRLEKMQEKNLAQLWQDFERHPPRYIGIVVGVGNTPGSEKIAAVPGFDDYLKRHCAYLKTMTRERVDLPERPLMVYRCNDR